MINKNTIREVVKSGYRTYEEAKVNDKVLNDGGVETITCNIAELIKKEKKELSGKYSLNNITTGTQFELYLVNLFKDLGYKTNIKGCDRKTVYTMDQEANGILLENGMYIVLSLSYFIIPRFLL